MKIHWLIYDLHQEKGLSFRAISRKLNKTADYVIERYEEALAMIARVTPTPCPSCKEEYNFHDERVCPFCGQADLKMKA